MPCFLHCFACGYSTSPASDIFMQPAWCAVSLCDSDSDTGDVRSKIEAKDHQLRTSVSKKAGITFRLQIACQGDPAAQILIGSFETCKISTKRTPPVS